MSNEWNLLQRFEHKRGASKIDTFIEFPMILNMSPFLSESEENNVSLPIYSRENEYHLFSVVNHKGSIDHGHYTSYIRRHDEVGTSVNLKSLVTGHCLSVGLVV